MISSNIEKHYKNNNLYHFKSNLPFTPRTISNQPLPNIDYESDIISTPILQKIPNSQLQPQFQPLVPIISNVSYFQALPNTNPINMYNFNLSVNRKDKFLPKIGSGQSTIYLRNKDNDDISNENINHNNFGDFGGYLDLQALNENIRKTQALSNKLFKQYGYNLQNAINCPCNHKVISFSYKC